MLHKPNKRVSYWETLHPETAAQTLSKDKEAYARKWDAVWTEAVQLDENLPQQQQTHHPPQQQQSAASPDNPTNDGGSDGGDGGDGGDGDDVEAVAETKIDTALLTSFCRHNCFVSIIGWSLLIVAVAATIAMELGGAIFFTLAAVFHWMIQKLDGLLGICLIQPIIGLVYVIFQLADGLLLVMGTFVTELLAVITLCLCLLFGGISAALEWHQEVRRLCHITRWSCRDFHDKWDCRRGELRWWRRWPAATAEATTGTAPTPTAEYGAVEINNITTTTTPTAPEEDVVANHIPQPTAPTEQAFVLAVDDFIIEVDPEDVIPVEPAYVIDDSNQKMS